MGVRDLWSILAPICEKKSLWELENKGIAIDLSAWVCDSQFVGDNSQINMYLRNLFFRTSYLILIGARPIFVKEGVAPELKHATISRRKQVQTQFHTQSKSGCRSRLNGLQKQCEELLACLGISCVCGEGEAEAYCAYLNEQGVVEGVLTQDSDALLYGATEVYRHFSLAPAYSCQVYRMAAIEARLGLGRHKLLALSLLCGCDYSGGVHGVGKESALKFLATIPDSQVLQRLRDWRNDTYVRMENSRRNYAPDEKLELSIRRKALLDPDFPSEDVIHEFLNRTQPVNFIYEWRQPDLDRFLRFADRKLAWDADYATEKLLPLLGRWHLMHPSVPSLITPQAVPKKRMLRGVASYEVVWCGLEGTTVEPQTLVNAAYPQLTQHLHKTKVVKQKAVNRRALGDMTSKLNEESPRKGKKKKMQKMEKGLQTLDGFLVKQSSSVKSVGLNDSWRSRVDESDVECNAYGSECDDNLDLSSIIETIVSRQDSNPGLVLLAHKMTESCSTAIPE